MSWEPDIPVGFSPCGIAFGALRGCYSAPASFYVDDTVKDNRIKWYFVPDDRAIYDDWTVFWPRSDTSQIEATSAHEQEGVPGRFRLHNNGEDIYLKPGLDVDGDTEDFLGNAPRSKYWIDGIPPVDPCPPLETIEIRLAIRIVAKACDCHFLALEHPIISVRILADDLPEWNDLSALLDVVISDPDVVWIMGTPPDPTIDSITMFCLDSISPCALSFTLFYDDGLGTGTSIHAFETGVPDWYVCDPLQLDCTAIGTEAPVLGKRIRFLINADDLATETKDTLTTEAGDPLILD